jgi:hypothetical protein
VIGSNVPTINPMTGGFIGGIRTNYRWFSMPKLPETLVDNLNLDSARQDDYNYQSPTYSRNKYGKPKHRPNYKGNVNLK